MQIDVFRFNASPLTEFIVSGYEGEGGKDKAQSELPQIINSLDKVCGPCTYTPIDNIQNKNLQVLMHYIE